MTGDRVLVSGVSGFIGKHVAAEFLRAGYRVRGTIRTPGREDEVRAAMAVAEADPAALECVTADLLADDGWAEAVRDCRYVAHTASPFPASIDRDRQALVPVARGGTLRVLEAARNAGVQRVVLTSSVAAIYYGRGTGQHRFGEADWTNVDDPGVTAYAVSKTEAERAAWAVLDGSQTSLAVINPALVLGPLLDRHAGTSARILAEMLRGRMPVVPNISLGVVDVRDVALAHRLALETPEAAGRRFVLSGGMRSLRQIGATLVEVLPERQRRLPRWTIPDVVVRAAARIVPPLRAVVPELGRTKALDTQPAETVLGMRFRSTDEAIASMAESLKRFALL